MRVAVCGCGIAGPVAAWWLRAAGHEPVLIDRAPAPRLQGYAVDVWGNGYDVLDRMGLSGPLRDEALNIAKLRAVATSGRPIATIETTAFRAETRGRFITLGRGRLLAALIEACRGIDMRFGTEVESLVQRPGQVVVRLSDGHDETFDLVIGADGLHSRIRELAFGPQERYERPLGLCVAALSLRGYRPRDEDAYVNHSEPGCQISRISAPEDETLFLFTFTADPNRPLPQADAEIRDILRDRFRPMGWEAPQILERLDDATAIYMDRVSQIRMPGWCRGRVALVGDAAAAPSLLAGEAPGLALTSAYVLAGEIARAPTEPRRGFYGYEDRLRAHLSDRQVAARKSLELFAPASRLRLALRNALLRLAANDGMARRVFGGNVSAGIDLPDYR